MIAEGIYNPITGESVKVQGAGTVYNEEKNSIALGKDTIADGQDQFVFGRNNVPDEGNVYAEIVGGGTISEVATEYTTELVDHIEDVANGNKVSLRDSSLPSGAPADYYYHYIKAGNSVEGFTSFINNWKGTNLTISVSDEHFTESNPIVAALIQKWAYDANESASTIVKNRTRFITADGKIWYATLVGGSGNVITLRNFSGYTLTKVKTYSDTVVEGNIRTLDWSGNEKLSGNLTVGGNLKIGDTTITEQQLTALLALLN